MHFLLDVLDLNFKLLSIARNHLQIGVAIWDFDKTNSEAFIPRQIQNEFKKVQI